MMKLSRKPKPTKGSAAARATEPHMANVGGSVLLALAAAANCLSRLKAFANSSLKSYNMTRYNL